MIKINVYRVLGNLGCNFFLTKKKPVENIPMTTGGKQQPKKRHVRAHTALEPSDPA